jgi:uroporphyrin-III C-methyltransferase/precorrin-2 dehydrogenase/sirohydrochlorin ferrochelatase/uroporphyrin-III C-methyltransferase
MALATQSTGKVSLVGAGPGDPDLLTIKALKAIQSADIVVYDRLVSEAIMALVPHGVTRFFVGKSCKQKVMPQEEIQELLVSLALKGNDVVRLKGGDPLMFGRGSEEALELAKHNIPFEIIPGITSAHGCGAYAGIPLTHRGLATGVRIITGHRTADEDKEEPLELNWQSLTDEDTTLVVYMGLANLALIAQKLVEYGLPPSFPAASIAHGTMPSQRTIIADLSTIAEKTKEAGLESPVLVIIGKVAALGADLAWFKSEVVDNADNYPKIFTKLSH